MTSGMIVSLGTLGAIGNCLLIYDADRLVSTGVCLPQDSPMFKQSHSINRGGGRYGLILCVFNYCVYLVEEEEEEEEERRPGPSSC
jgi:hypothetical protein